jgi:hypothetical protein
MPTPPPENPAWGSPNRPRPELHDIGDHLAERLASLADRLDRAIDH